MPHNHHHSQNQSSSPPIPSHFFFSTLFSLPCRCGALLMHAVARQTYATVQATFWTARRGVQYRSIEPNTELDIKCVWFTDYVCMVHRLKDMWLMLVVFMWACMYVCMSAVCYMYLHRAFRYVCCVCFVYMHVFVIQYYICLCLY